MFSRHLSICGIVKEIPNKQQKVGVCTSSLKIDRSTLELSKIQAIADALNVEDK